MPLQTNQTSDFFRQDRYYFINAKLYAKQRCIKIPNTIMHQKKIEYWKVHSN